MSTQSTSILAQIISGSIEAEYDLFAFNPYEDEYQCELGEEDYEEYDPTIHDAPCLDLSILMEDEEQAERIIDEYPSICREAIFWYIQDVSSIHQSYLQWIASIAWQANYSPLLELSERLLHLITK